MLEIQRNNANYSRWNKKTFGLISKVFFYS
jgi:hypothetical protein